MLHKKMGIQVQATEQKIEDVRVIMHGEESGIFTIPVSLYIKGYVNTTDELLKINEEVNEAVHEVEQKMAEIKREKEKSMQEVEKMFEEIDKDVDAIVSKIMDRIFNV